MLKKPKNKKFAGAVQYDVSEVEVKAIDAEFAQKTESYIKKLYLKVKSTINTLISKLRTTHESDLSKYNDRNVLQMFLDWSLEIFQYGVLLCIFVNVFIKPVGWHNLYLWAVFGLTRWFILDTLTEIKRALK